MAGESSGPFRYHLELTPEQLKVTYAALHALLDGYGHDEADVRRVVHEVLAKLPDESAIRAISLNQKAERKLRAVTPDEDPGGGSAPGGSSPGDPSSAA